MPEPAVTGDQVVGPLIAATLLVGNPLVRVRGLPIMPFPGAVSSEGPVAAAVPVSARVRVFGFPVMLRVLTQATVDGRTGTVTPVVPLFVNVT